MTDADDVGNQGQDRQKSHCTEKRYIIAVLRGCTYFLVVAAFGLGAALFFLYARIRTVNLDPLSRRRATRSVIHSGISLLFRVLQSIGLLRIEHAGHEARSPAACEAAVIVANHPSMLDALFFLSRHPQVVCVMKGALLGLPVIGGFARAAGYLPYHETDELWERARAARDEGASILIFPEGTRSPQCGLGEFKRGAGRIAAELGLPLLPYVLEMTPIVLGRGAPWWRPPTETVVLKVTSLPPLVSQLAQHREGVAYTTDELRRESVRLTELLEVLIGTSLRAG